MIAVVFDFSGVPVPIKVCASLALCNFCKRAWRKQYTRRNSPGGVLQVPHNQNASELSALLQHQRSVLAGDTRRGTHLGKTCESYKMAHEAHSLQYTRPSTLYGAEGVSRQPHTPLTEGTGETSIVMRPGVIHGMDVLLHMAAIRSNVCSRYTSTMLANTS